MAIVTIVHSSKKRHHNTIETSFFAKSPEMGAISVNILVLQQSANRGRVRRTHTDIRPPYSPLSPTASFKQ
ncbi:hypothetical protein ACFWXH_02400 [Mesorhizobium sp. NPDC059054]|uniref:hypothetical protein n=1 Tax=Mesorhizobium sp. NPDC059054 TaxID=3346711 RepID=UPI0036744CBD